MRHTGVALIVTALYTWLELRWIAVPWLPISLLGIVVSFGVGFKNNASYDRTWEARRVWGAIVNGSRAWGLMVRDFVTDRHVKDTQKNLVLGDFRRDLMRRHFAWLTALRYQLRVPRTWEAAGHTHNMEYRRKWFRVEEQEVPLERALSQYISGEELSAVLASTNKATQIASLQSRELERLLKHGLVEDFRHMELQKVLNELLAQQGAAERIKNFPYPRQYATINHIAVNLFVTLIPFGMLQEFERLGGGLIWMTVPFSALCGWIFTTIERIGESTENPFEGSANDVPITAMARAIEIELLEMLRAEDVPPPVAPQNGILL
jgi:putative membrane protein